MLKPHYGQIPRNLNANIHSSLQQKTKLMEMDNQKQFEVQHQPQEMLEKKMEEVWEWTSVEQAD